VHSCTLMCVLFRTSYLYGVVWGQLQSVDTFSFDLRCSYVANALHVETWMWNVTCYYATLSSSFVFPEQNTLLLFLSSYISNLIWMFSYCQRCHLSEPSLRYVPVKKICFTLNMSVYLWHLSYYNVISFFFFKYIKDGKWVFNMIFLINWNTTLSLSSYIVQLLQRITNKVLNSSILDLNINSGNQYVAIYEIILYICATGLLKKLHSFPCLVAKSF